MQYKNLNAEYVRAIFDIYILPLVRPFSTPKCIPFLQQSNTWYADGTFKLVLEYLFQLYTIHSEKDGYVFPCVNALLPDKRECNYSNHLRKLLEICLGLNPTSTMIVFEKAAIISFDEHFLPLVLHDVSFTFPKIYTERYNLMDYHVSYRQILNSV